LFVLLWVLRYGRKVLPNSGRLFTRLSDGAWASQERALVKFQISTKARQLICPSELSGDCGSKGVDFAGDGATKGREGGNGGDRDQSCGNRVL